MSQLGNEPRKAWEVNIWQGPFLKGKVLGRSKICPILVVEIVRLAKLNIILFDI